MAMMTNNETRQEIETLLPWFAAGTLDPKDAERVERALMSDPVLSRDFDLVRDELAETIRLNESLGAPSARAMARLFEKIDAEPAREPVVAPSLGIAARVSDFIASLSPRTLAWSGAAAAFAILLQAGVITGVLLNERGGQGRYDTVAAPQSAPAEAGTFALVRFAPQANAGDITKFLEDHKASIVSGPAAGGLYRVRVAATAVPQDEAARLVKQLQDDKIIGFAAPAP
jgi:hypothetical protein